MAAAVVLLVLPQAGASAGSGAPKERELISNGAWSWFGDPRAVYDGERTYVGWIDASGNIEVASYEHHSGVRRVGTLDTGFEVDDHNNPSILLRPDGRLLVFWSGHGGPAMHYRLSTNPHDVTSWGPKRTLPTNTEGTRGFTYPNPVRLADEDRTYLFWRGGNFNPNFSTSADEGTTWSAARTVVSSPGHRPYVKYHGNGTDTIAMAFTEAHPRDVRTGIYYAAYRDGAFRRADGTEISTMANLPFTSAQAEKIYDPAIDGRKAWVHDVALDAGDNPVIVYATFASDNDHRYRYARWDGTAWRHSEITRAGRSMSESTGEPNYSGGITLDHEDPLTMYLSRQVNGVFEVEQWHTPDNGASWVTTPITSDSTRSNFRPISPRGQDGDELDVVWMHGRYPSYTRYQTGLRTRSFDRRPAEAAAVAWNGDRLDVLARDSDTGSLLHKHYTADPRSWSGWTDLGLAPGDHRIGTPTVASWGSKRLDAFAVDQSTGRLLQRTYDGRADGWGDWVDRGSGPSGHAVVGPSAVSWASGRIDVVARDAVTDKLLHWWQQSGVWRGPEVLANGPGGDYTPAIASWASRRLDVFAVDSGGRLRQFYFDGSRWRGWQNLGYGPSGKRYRGPATATSWGSRRLDVFARTSGADALIHRSYDKGWRGPALRSLGPDKPLVAGAAATTRGSGRLDVFTIDKASGSLLQLNYTGAWKAPVRLDFAGPPA